MFDAQFAIFSPGVQEQSFVRQNLNMDPLKSILIRVANYSYSG